MTVEEVWVPIKGFNKYAISNYGRVRNVRLNHIVSGTERSNGTQVQLLNPRGELVGLYIHRLVAETFLPKYKDGKQYRQQDVMEMLPIELPANFKFLPLKRRYIQLIGTDELFENVKDAAKALETSPATIYRLLKGEIIWADRGLKYVWK